MINDIQKTRKKLKRVIYIQDIAEIVLIGAVIALIILVTVAAYNDFNHIKTFTERVDSVTMLDINGDTITIEPNGKYTRIFKN